VEADVRRKGKCAGFGRSTGDCGGGVARESFSRTRGSVYNAAAGRAGRFLGAAPSTLPCLPPTMPRRAGAPASPLPRRLIYCTATWPRPVAERGFSAPAGKSIEVEVCMGMGKTGIPWVPWDSHGNGSKISHGMGMGIKCMGMGVGEDVGIGKKRCIV